MRRQILDYHRPLPREAVAAVGGPVGRVACAVLRTGSRAGAVAQPCLAIAVWGILVREQAGIATIFWRREVMVATALSLLWVAWPCGDGRRRQALGFLVANAVGWGVAALTPVLVS